MSKQSIAWHEECLKNLRASFDRAAVRLQDAQDEYDRMKILLGTRENQINEAKRQGKDSFDQDKFFLRRRK